MKSAFCGAILGMFLWSIVNVLMIDTKVKHLQQRMTELEARVTVLENFNNIDSSYGERK